MVKFFNLFSTRLI